MSRKFSQELQAKRTKLYYDLLNSSDSVQVRLNNDPDIRLMYIDDRGLPVYYKTDNLNAAITISTNDVWPGGTGGFSLTGSGTGVGKLGIWDGGAVLATHQELSGRVTQIDNPSSTHYHATHVAGTMIASGVQSAAQGMSYQANLTAYDWNNDNAEMASAAASGMNVSNHSYGLITGWYFSGSWYWYGDIGISTTEDYGFGFYSSDAQSWDQIAYDAPYYTIVKSAGNDRNDTGPGAGGGHYVWSGGSWVWSTATRDPDGGTTGYDCISYAGNAKNIITVGAVDDIVGGYSAPGDVVMSSFSGWGPSDDGRIKPDIVANGISLYSTMDNNNTAYDYLSGTSMSSPNLSGSLNLLVRHYEATHGNISPRSSTMKSVLIQTADESGPNPGPDYMFGWGLMNTLSAVQLIQLDSVSQGVIIEAALNNAAVDQYDFYSDGTQPIRITMAWTDPAGTSPAPALDPPTIMLVNDLDLRLENIDSGSVYYPYILDPNAPANAATTGDNIRDNVEQVYLASPAPGNYRLTVSHKGSLAAAQYYSLASSTDLQTPQVNNPPVALCANIIASADSLCQADASIDNGSYDPDGDPISLVQVPPGPYPLGTTTVSLIVTDSSGLADTCQGSVTVNDNTPPVVLCPNNIIVSNDSGQCGAIVTFNVSATDNCAGVNISSVPASGSFFPVGTTLVEAIAVDTAGNADTCYFNVTVIDSESPVVACPADTTVSPDSGQCDAIVTFNVTASDNCPGFTVTSNPPSGSLFPAGTTQVEVIAADSSGNADTCYFNVTVSDTEPPVLACPGDIVAGSDSGQCGAVVLFTPTATDNCGTVNIVSNPPSGSLFPIGITQVEAVATDASGNADTCYFNVTVNDTEAPVALCPSDIIVSNDSGQCSAIVPFSINATDNCPGVVVSSNPPSGSQFPLGVTMVEVVAVDSAGNADTCYFNVTVNDTEPPAALCPADTIIIADSGSCGAVVSYSVNATDNCPGATVTSTPLSGSLFSVGTTAVEVVATDSSGNADTCYFNITVLDNENPVLSCPVDTIVTSDPGLCGAVVSFTPSATDNCVGTSITSNPPSGSLFPVGITPVEIVATDASGNADTCYFNITVNDNEAPVVTCPLDIVIGNDPGLCGATVSFTATASDNCSIASINYNPASGSFFPLGITQVEVVAVDSSGNADTCYFNVTVFDNEAPTAICPVDTVVARDSGLCTATVFFSVSSNDNCLSSTVSANPPSGSQFPVGITQVEVVAVDSSGNADTCYFNITVDDLEPPVIVCPTDTIVNNDPGQCGAVVSYTATATDNCPGVNVTSNPSSGSFFAIGTTQVEIIATDAVGNADTCYFNVTVNDIEPPVVVCPADTAVVNDSGQCGASVFYTVNATDNCPGGTLLSSPPPGSFFPIGLTQVEVIASDSSGNADTCYFNVTVSDTEAPIISCPPVTVANADSGLCEAVVVFNVDVSDNCSTVTVTTNPLSGSAFPVGVTQVEVAAIDSSGNADTCHFNIIVLDNEAPSIICPTDTVVSSDSGLCGAAVVFTASAADNCSTFTIQSNPPSGSVFPVGTTNTEVIATDASGNADTCYFNVTVIDTEPPVIDCPADIIVGTDPGQCSAVATFTVNATDNCSNVAVTTNPPSGSLFPIGVTSVEVVATDASGNADTCYFNLIVNDTEPPLVLCPGDIALTSDSGQCGAIVTFPLNAYDNCPGVTVTSNPPSGSFFGGGSTYVTAIATDSSGNADTCYFFVSVYDNEYPDAGCIGDQIISNDPGDCGAAAVYSLNAWDNCPGYRLNIDPPQGSFLSIGTTPVQVIAIDGAGNADTCYFNAIVEDVEPPVAICPVDTTVSSDSGQCGAIVDFTINATDNCSGVTVASVPPSGSQFPVGVTQVEVVAIDSTGNADTCFFNITVNDVEPPVIACLQDTVVVNDSGQCGAVVTFSASATDNCSLASLVSSPPSGSLFLTGTTQVELVAVDSSGNADTCYFNITVIDNEPPVVFCPADTIVPNDSGQCGASVSYAVSATDNCPGVSVISNPPSGSFFPVGLTQVEVIASDSSGNADTCYFNITVNDIESPSVLCPVDTFLINDPGLCGAAVLFNPTAIDNCPGVAITTDPPSGSIFPPGISPVRVIAIDSSGNADTCFFNVTVNDTEPPSITCPQDIVVDAPPMDCGTAVSFSVNATDNCSTVTILSNPPSGYIFPVGITQVEVVASDSSGNADTCYFNITVNDTGSPNITCPNDTTVENDRGQCGAVVAFTPEVFDNCSDITIVSNPPSGSFFSMGITNVDIIATDYSGNYDTCSFKINVIDSEPPVAICPSDLTIYVDTTQTGANVDFIINAIDNCDSVSVSSNPASGSWFGLGITQVEVIATDAAGLEDTCYFNVNVSQAPVPIPTLSEWGMLIMGLLLLAIGTVAVIRKSKNTISEID